MIKINLATRKQSNLSGEPKTATSLGGSLENFKLESLKELPFKKAMIPIAIGIVAYMGLDSYKEDVLLKMNNAAKKIESENTRLEAEISKFKAYDAIKKSLEEDEATITTKLQTIRSLIADRNTPPRMLVSLANALPKEVWITEFRIENSNITFRGGSLDFNHISDFMKGLSEIAFFSEVELKTTQQSKDDTAGDMATFELSAKRRKE